MNTLNKILILSIAGMLFSGYLSAVKLFSQTCAIDSGCSYFLGYPTCYYGFAFFVLIFILTLANKFCSWGGEKLAVARLNALRAVSALGIAFSLYFSVVEIWKMISEKMVYGALILPTCFYGLIVYIWVFVLAMKLRSGQKDESENEVRSENEQTPNEDLKEESEEENPHIA